MTKLICPYCKQRKLPYDRHPYKNSNGETERLRRCECGYVQLERVTVEIIEFIPESAPIPTPKHPGEGGYGPASA